MSIFYKNQRLSHMSKGDAYLWTKFLDKNPDTFFNIQYDVKVGKGVQLPPSSPEWLIRSADNLSKKRIDVVAENTKNVFVIECRVNAKANVIGELIVYRYLYVLTQNPTKPTVPLLISDSFDADLLIALHELKLMYFLV